MPKYDIALSFAGEDRAVVDALADALRRAGMHVFYDMYEKANLWGKDLYTHLIGVYRSEAKYCLMFLSESYAKKQWTNLERQAAQARAFKESREYILPVRLDDTEVPGILETVGYVDMRTTSLEELVELVTAKIVEYNRIHGIDWELVRVQKVLEKAGISAAGHFFNDSEFDTDCPACRQVQNLALMPMSVEGSETTYTCRNGCMPLVVVGRPGQVPWENRGWRLGDYVIRNVRDLVIHSRQLGAPLVLNARTAALMKQRPEH